MLLEHGVDISVQDNLGATALHHAVAKALEESAVIESVAWPVIVHIHFLRYSVPTLRLPIMTVFGPTGAVTAGRSRC